MNTFDKLTSGCVTLRRLITGCPITYPGIGLRNWPSCQAAAIATKLVDGTADYTQGIKYTDFRPTKFSTININVLYMVEI